MSNTKWRISGGLGEPEKVNQVMTQGIGYPLRPVDGTPSGDVDLADIPIAEGVFMQWMGHYEAGLLYPQGSVVLDSGWTMIALEHTVTKPAPVPSGNPSYGLPDDPAFTESAVEAVVYSGHTYEFAEGGWLKSLRVWVPELSGTTHYRIIIIDETDPNKPQTQIINDPVLLEGGWKTIAYADAVVTAGTKLRIVIDALNSGSETVVTGGWTFGGSSGNAPTPAEAEWTRKNNNTAIRINVTDLDGLKRGTEILGFIPGTEVQFAETADPNRSQTFLIQGAPTDNGEDIEFSSVSLLSTGPAGSPRSGQATTMTATVPVAQSTKYVQLNGEPTPSWATVTPYLAYDGTEQPATGLAFGVDIDFDPAVVNTAWDVIATTEI